MDEHLAAADAFRLAGIELKAATINTDTAHAAALAAYARYVKARRAYNAAEQEFRVATLQAVA